MQKRENHCLVLVCAGLDPRLVLLDLMTLDRRRRKGGGVVLERGFHIFCFFFLFLKSRREIPISIPGFMIIIFCILICLSHSLSLRVDKIYHHRRRIYLKNIKGKKKTRGYLGVSQKAFKNRKGKKKEKFNLLDGEGHKKEEESFPHGPHHGPPPRLLSLGVFFFALKMPTRSSSTYPMAQIHLLKATPPPRPPGPRPTKEFLEITMISIAHTLRRKTSTA